MALVAEGIIDPTKVGKYPVILSDALLGKTTSKEVFTGVRYNHRPETVPSFARLKPTPTNKTASYDLSFLDDNGGKYTYQGTRNINGSQYVLVFDAKREAFILHKIDSTFNVNLIRTPNNNDPESLKEEYPHIEGSMPKKPNKEAKSKKQEKDKSSSGSSGGGMLTMPEKPAKSTPRRREPSPDEEEEEDDDDDGGLILEFPEDDAVPVGDFSPAFNSQSNPGFKVRRFSEIFSGDQQDDEDADADAESDDGMEDMMEQFKLPSPVNNPPANENTSRHAPAHEEQEEEDEDEEDGGVDLEDMLEAELEAEFEMEENSGHGNQADSESDVSEED